MKIVADFRSDNTAAACRAVLSAFHRMGRGRHAAYGDDEHSAALAAAFGRIVGVPVAAFPVVSGTAANALSLAVLLPDGGTIYGHRHAHIVESEDDAYRVFRPASRLVTVAGDAGRIDAAALSDALRQHAGPGVLSLTQLTEAGTRYTLDALRELAGIARRAGLRIHVDGARIGNAVVGLGVPCSELVAAVSPDAISFGATKNGAAIADAVLLTDPSRFDRAAIKSLMLRTGHDVSKAWYVSAQLLAYLEGDLWLRNARRANAAAASLWKRIAPLFPDRAPPEANELFLPVPEPAQRRLRELGIGFHPWHDTGDIRLVASWATTAREVTLCAEALGDALA